MSIGRKISFLLTAVCALALLLCALFFCAPLAAAENPAPVLLSSDTLFSVSPTHLAYTSGNSLSIVDLSYNKDPFTLENAFEGEAKDLKMTSGRIAVLSQSGEKNILTVLSYDNDAGVIDPSATFPAADETALLSAAVCLGVLNEEFLLMSQKCVYNIDAKLMYYVPLVIDSSSGVTEVYYDGASCFYIPEDAAFGAGNMLFAKEAELYLYDTSRTDYSTVSKLTAPSTIYGMTPLSQGLLAVSCADGIYAYDAEKNSLSKLPGVLYPSKIDSEGGFLYAFDASALSIKRYTITGGALIYNKCYDAEEYNAPEARDIVLPAAAKEGDELVLYRSPRDLEVVARVKGSVLALTRVVYDDGGVLYPYYYCVTESGKYGYVPEGDAALRELTSPEFTAAQPLHGTGETPVYTFPVKSSAIEAYLSTDSSGAVLSLTPGSEEKERVILSVSGLLDVGATRWARVYLSHGDEVGIGYVDARLVCPYVAYSPAGVDDFCLTDSKRAGVYVALYAQPDETSEVLGELPDGSELRLVSAFDEESLWTCVYYGDTMAYVLTENLTVSALTTVQITLIIVLCVLAVLGAALAIVITIKRKKKRDSNEET